MEKLRKITIFITLLLILITLPLYSWKVLTKTDYTDFDVYYRSATRADHLQWNEVYTLQDGASPFRYAPAWIPFFQVFSQFPLPQAKQLWYFFQFFCFGLGFYFLYRTALACRKPRDRSYALWMTCLGVLFILRFCLDTFTIGQVSGLMFLGFCFALYAWVIRLPAWAAVGVWIPTLFKIGPGFLLGVFLSGRIKSIKKGISGSVVLLAFFAAGFSLWAGSLHLMKLLWQGWLQIVVNDSSYYDASHYGSQSLKSVILRGVRFHWISPELAQPLYLVLTVLICAGIFFFWILRKPRSLFGRGLFFTLGLFAYFWVMPETFKYSLTPLAIPAILLALSKNKDLFTWFSLGFGALTLSLAGKDIVGDTLFFGLQHYSIPFLATVFLGISIFREAWRESFSSPLARALSFALKSGNHALGPWRHLPQSEPKLEVSVLIPLPLRKSYTINPDLVRKQLQEFHHWLNPLTQSQFEILIIPYGDRVSHYHPVMQEVDRHTQDLKNIQILSHSTFSESPIEGRGSALREGFLKSQGKRILILQIEQPCHIHFYQEAFRELDSGIDLIRANRRLEKSRFIIPVRSLSLIYSRHRLGMLFNRIVQFLLPVQTSDTLSGNLAVSRRLATHVFAVQSSSDILFDLELNLTTIANQYREKDLPVRLFLAGEKSFSRILFETLSILRGLPILAWRYKKGFYNLLPQPTAITADDWGLSPGVNQGILKLCRLGIVKRVSLMANCTYLKDGLQELSSIPGVSLGLHFNLTYGKPLQSPNQSNTPLLVNQGTPQTRFISSPGKFLLHWISPFSDRNANRNHVRTELLSQLEKLKQAGVSVQYIDGHQHIHLVPGLLKTLADIIQNAGIQQVRLPYDLSLWKSTKAPLVILSLLAKYEIRKQGFQSLPFIYPQAADFLDQGRLRARIARSPNSEVIVHPAEMNDIGSLEFPDSYTHGRITEFQALRMLKLQ